MSKRIRRNPLYSTTETFDKLEELIFQIKTTVDSEHQDQGVTVSWLSDGGIIDKLEDLVDDLRNSRFTLTHNGTTLVWVEMELYTGRVVGRLPDTATSFHRSTNWEVHSSDTRVEDKQEDKTQG